MAGDIGGNLKELRLRSGMTLRDLSASSGLSTTLLSQVERGISEPSLKTLRALSVVFAEAGSALFAGSTSTILHLSRPGQRSRLSTPAGHIQYERVTPNNGQIEVLRGTLSPGQWSSDQPWAHEAVECAFVDEGEIIVEVNGREHHLVQGEALTFSSSQPHRYGNLGERDATFILSVSPPTP